ncbi:unnamed protein product [Symbiodinium sp. CCMP2592]|nr:unnamed protein product [Symbiodinium sp. CCMP2592]
MSSQRLFDSQVMLDNDSVLFDSQVDPGTWAAGRTLASPVVPAASSTAVHQTGLKRKNACLEWYPPPTIVNINEDPSPKPKPRNEVAEKSSEKSLQEQLEASQSKVSELQELNRTLHCKAAELAQQLVQVMEEKNNLLAEKHAKMIADLRVVRSAREELDELLDLNFDDDDDQC